MKLDLDDNAVNVELIQVLTAQRDQLMLEVAQWRAACHKLATAESAESPTVD